MKLILFFMGSILASIFQGCGGPGTSPTTKELAGTWVSSESAALELSMDGTFVGKLLPADLFIISTEEYKGKKFDCSGKWMIKNTRNSNDQLPWVIYLDIQTSNNNYLGSSSILISGDNFLENKGPWKYLFLWQGEEGGNRYKFEKR